MDYFKLRDVMYEDDIVQKELSPIQQVYEGATVLITGASGFMGRCLIEKLLRTCNLAEIYILVRDKKGVKCQDRVSAVFDDVFFEPLKLQKPGEVKKVKIVAGDCSLPDLGLSDKDKAGMSNVNIIFHAAATLYMDQHLKVAFNTNVLATKCLLEFAQTLRQLQAFIYISTAFTHAYKGYVEEKFYDVVFNGDDLANICNQLDDVQIGALTPKLVGKWNNTYSLTKACAEDVIRIYSEVLPVCIIRPSIVVPTSTEPLQGWINNIYGAVGVVLGTGIGILNVWGAGPDMIGDMIPVDMVVNMTLAATREVITKNSDEKIYNCVSSTINPITWDFLRSSTFRLQNAKTVDTIKALAYPNLHLTKNKFVFWLFTMWYHAIPAVFLDLFLQLIGKSPLLMKVYVKVYSVNKMLSPYCSEKQILFSSENIKQMWDNLLPIDKKLFNFDLWTIKWTTYWFECARGVRVYLLKDPMDTLPEGIKHSFRLKVRSYALTTVVWLTITALLYFFTKDHFASALIK